MYTQVATLHKLLSRGSEWNDQTTILIRNLCEIYSSIVIIYGTNNKLKKSSDIILVLHHCAKHNEIQYCIKMTQTKRVLQLQLFHERSEFDYC